VTPEVEAEVRKHVLIPGYTHTDYQALLCRCTEPAPKKSYADSLPDGGACHVCGGMMVRTGTCSTCTQCGETGGCG
jgi:hypothetical protein